MELNIVPGVQRRRTYDSPTSLLCLEEDRFLPTGVWAGVLGWSYCFSKRLNGGWWSGIYEEEQWSNSPLLNRVLSIQTHYNGHIEEEYVHVSNICLKLVSKCCVALWEMQTPVSARKLNISQISPYIKC